MRPSRQALALNWQVLLTIQGKDFRALLYGKSLYIAAFLAFGIATLIMRSYFNFVDQYHISVLAQPFYLPLFACVLIASVYLALVASTSISREKDRGTLETLFYAPVDHTAYILSKYIAHILAYGLFIVGTGLLFVAASVLTGLSLSVSVWWGMLLSLFTASCFIAYGMLLSSLTSGVRTSLLLFLSSILLFGGMQVVHEVVLSATAGGAIGAVQYVRQVIVSVQALITWLSPLSYLTQGMEAIEIGSASSYSVLLLSSILYTAVLLTLAIAALRWKGVRKR